MKKLSSAIMLAFAVCILQGCNNAREGANQNADSLHQIAGKVPQTPDTSGTRGALPTPDTGKKHRTRPKPLVMKVDNADAKFAMDATRGSLAEIAMSVDASQITRDEKIKRIADTLITSQGRISDELVAIARAKNVIMPMFISPDMDKKREALKKKSGKDFDKAYISEMITGHQKALKLYKDAAKNCTDADLRAFAAKTVPRIQMYLDAVSKL
jgi:putative membrane protein